MDFNIPNRETMSNSDKPKDEPQSRAIESISFGNTRKDTLERKQLQQAESHAESVVNHSEGPLTVIGEQAKPSGRPADRAKLFGPKKTIGWVTFQAQQEVLEKLLDVSDAKSKTHLFELALAALVREHLEKGHFDDIDINLAQNKGHLE